MEFNNKLGNKVNDKKTTATAHRSYFDMENRKKEGNHCHSYINQTFKTFSENECYIAVLNTKSSKIREKSKKLKYLRTLDFSLDLRWSRRHISIKEFRFAHRTITVRIPESNSKD